MKENSRIGLTIEIIKMQNIKKKILFTIPEMTDIMDAKGRKIRRNKKIIIQTVGKAELVKIVGHYDKQFSIMSNDTSI